MEWTQRVDQLLYDGETERQRVSVGPATVVVTSHRVLVFRPDGNPRFREVDRPNVGSVGVESRGRLRHLVWATILGLLGVGGALAATLFSVADLVPGLRIDGGTGEVPGGDPTGDVFGALETLLTLIDLSIAAFSLVLLLVAVVLLVRYVVSRSRRLVIEVHGDETVELPLERTAQGVVYDLEDAIQPGGPGGTAVGAGLHSDATDRGADDSSPDPIGSGRFDPDGIGSRSDDPVVSRGDRLDSSNAEGPTTADRGGEQRTASGVDTEDSPGGFATDGRADAVGPRASEQPSFDGETSDPFDDRDDREETTDPFSERDDPEAATDPFDGQDDGFGDTLEDDWPADTDPRNPFGESAADDGFETGTDDPFDAEADDEFESLEDGPFDETSTVDEVTLGPDEFTVETVGPVEESASTDSTDEPDGDGPADSEGGELSADDGDGDADRIDLAESSDADEATEDPDEAIEDADEDDEDTIDDGSPETDVGDEGTSGDSEGG
ncbi:hypothetical protein [Halopiger goleimassiliensis]|uniref:hypothetical protein n=1 Tax=Halopiger goleimassiliensis TaxID=1293048 RepID=UPI000677933C|nr:hypothetical protein [Halopiger goleimassiliensis]